MTETDWSAFEVDEHGVIVNLTPAQSRRLTQECVERRRLADAER